MAVLKCKMCGGDLNITADEKIIECEFCGTTQTIPDGNDEKKTNLFNRANRLRIANEFDKAAGIYESLIAEFPDEAESYWGLCLCKFGIEYVDDPKTAKKIPTCHRTSFESIFDDENYKIALENSDVIAQGVYKEEATVIDNLQKDILSIVHKEEPFDVFICYKETDELGQRTQDSVLAQDIYDALTDKGFKVFFSRITLEDKLGKQYEPYIFAALNSAKVMLAISTKEEYYNAVWVKNEWSRYLALMESDKSKMLIPCYRDIDPYDMPQEFKNLQGQDMSKLGFMQDLIRGIKKITKADETETTVIKETVISGTNANTAPLLERAFMFLEDGDWNSANEYCEKVLDIEPKCAEAYLVKMMADLHVKRQSDLQNYYKPFDTNPNYSKVVMFGDELLKNELSKILDTINEKRKKSQEFYRVKNLQKYITAGFHTIGLKSDGTVVAVGNNECGQCDVNEWTDIVAVSAGIGHTVGLKSNGTVVATKCTSDITYKGQCDVDKWKDIVGTSAGSGHTIGLKSDGTVVAVGDNGWGQCDVDKWNDIISISAGFSHTIGLKLDGTVVAVGNDTYGQCNVGGWEGIVAISAEHNHTVGLKVDGTVVAVGDNKYGECNVNKWTDIVAISAGYRNTFGLKSNGTVVAVGDNEYNQCNVGEWKDIVDISVGNGHVVGLKADGTAVAAGNNHNGQCYVGKWEGIMLPTATTYAELDAIRHGFEKNRLYNHAKKLIDKKIYHKALCILEQITDHLNAKELIEEIKIVQKKHIENYLKENSKLHEQFRIRNMQSYVAEAGAQIFCLKNNGTVMVTDGLVDGKSYGIKQEELVEFKSVVEITGAWEHFVALKSDGTVVAVGDNDEGQCDVVGWTDMVAIFTTWNQTYGLKSDGTVVAVGDNGWGQCDVDKWNDIISISASGEHTVGLKSDGTVVAVGFKNDGRCDVGDWKDIVAISAGSSHTVGLKSDGTVVAVGSNTDGQCDVDEWTDIVAISAGHKNTFGLKSDGTVVAVGNNTWGQCNVDDWKDIVEIAMVECHTVGLKSDGTVVAVGDNDCGQCDVDDWKDIVAIFAWDEQTAGLKSDGTVVVTKYVGENEYYNNQSSVKSWNNLAIPTATTVDELVAARQNMKFQSEKAEIMYKYQSNDVCQHCGGEFKGLFVKKCVKCGRKKDY